MKKRWKICLLVFVSALALSNGVMAAGRTKQKTWWRQKLINADRELLGSKAAVEIGNTPWEDWEPEKLAAQEALKKWRAWNSLTSAEKYNMYKRNNEMLIGAYNENGEKVWILAEYCQHIKPKTESSKVRKEWIKEKTLDLSRNMKYRGIYHKIMEVVK